MTGEITTEGAVAGARLASPHASGGNRNHREIDHRVAQPRARSRYRNRHEVIVPHANEPDLSEIPSALRSKIKIHLARELDEVLGIALVGFKPATKKAKRTPDKGSKKSRPSQPTVGMA